MPREKKGEKKFRWKGAEEGVGDAENLTFLYAGARKKWVLIYYHLADPVTGEDFFQTYRKTGKKTGKGKGGRKGRARVQVLQKGSIIAGGAHEKSTPKKGGSRMLEKTN